MDRHHNSLVLSLQIGYCRVAKVLIDNGSTTNILTLHAFKAIGLEFVDISRKATTLVGFCGETRETIGTVSLHVYAKGINLQVKFEVVNALFAYNAILGTLWIHDMRAVPSPLHQVVKFPTP